MIKISVSEGAAFDILSIFEIKKAQAISVDKKENIVKQIEELMIEINSQLGYDLAKRIYHSTEYNALYSVNMRLFELIDLSKKTKMDAETLDSANYQRFLAKEVLQKSFFGGGLNEIKIGYDKLQT